MNKYTHPKLMGKVVKNWKRYCKRIEKTISVTDVIPAQLFLDAYIAGYRQGQRDNKRGIRFRH